MIVKTDGRFFAGDLMRLKRTGEPGAENVSSVWLGARFRLLSYNTMTRVWVGNFTNKGNASYCTGVHTLSTTDAFVLLESRARPDAEVGAP